MLGIELLGLKVAVGTAHNSAERYDPPQCRPHTTSYPCRSAQENYGLDWSAPQSPSPFYVVDRSSWDREVGNCTDDCRSLLRSRATCRKLFLFSDCSWSKCWHLSYPNNHLPAGPEIRGLVAKAVEQNPLLLTLSFQAQVFALIIQPLKQAAVDPILSVTPPILIILNGLDEWGNPKS